MKKIVRLIPCVLIVLVLCGCTDKVHESEDFVMSTYLRQQTYGMNNEKAAKEAELYFSSLEDKLSMFTQGSDITRINNSAGQEPVQVGADTMEILSIALEFSEASSGSFDVSVAPLTSLWGIDTDGATIPAAEEISNMLHLVDYNNIVVNTENSTVFLKENGMKLDLGGIAKGYAAKGVFEIYERYKLSGGLCSIGGNIFVYGKKPDSQVFTLGIRTPEIEPDEALLGKLSVTDTTVSTAGGYERYFEKEGKIYHHILDTRTGYPSSSDLLSVTVISADGARADALSTTIFLAGSEAIPKYINDDQFSVIIVDNQKKVYISPTLSKTFTLTNSRYSLAENY